MGKVWQCELGFTSSIMWGPPTPSGLKILTTLQLLTTLCPLVSGNYIIFVTCFVKDKMS